MNKHNFGRTLKLESAVVTLDIRSRSSKSNFLTPNNVSMQIWRERSGSVVESLLKQNLVLRVSVKEGSKLLSQHLGIYSYLNSQVQ